MTNMVWLCYLWFLGMLLAADLDRLFLGVVFAGVDLVFCARSCMVKRAASRLLAFDFL